MSLPAQVPQVRWPLSKSALQELFNIVYNAHGEGDADVSVDSTGLVVRVDAADAVDASFTVRAVMPRGADRTKFWISVRAGGAYMVNEPIKEFADTVLEVPSVAGVYWVWLRHNYGYGWDHGTWGNLTVSRPDDIPAEIVSGRVIGRNFRISTITVVNVSGRLRMDRPLQNWVWGDVTGYAPTLAPGERPVP